MEQTSCLIQELKNRKKTLSRLSLRKHATVPLSLSLPGYTLIVMKFTFEGMVNSFNLKYKQSVCNIGGAAHWLWNCVKVRSERYEISFRTWSASASIFIASPTQVCLFTTPCHSHARLPSCNNQGKGCGEQLSSDETLAWTTCFGSAHSTV